MNTDTGEIINLLDIFGKDSTEKERSFYFKNHHNIKPIFRSLTLIENETKKIDKNSPCGCGKNAKFKNCCYTGRRRGQR